MLRVLILLVMSVLPIAACRSLPAASPQTHANAVAHADDPGSATDPESAPSIRDSFVTVAVRGRDIKANAQVGDADGERTRGGVVLAEGRVLVTFTCLAGAEWVEVEGADGTKGIAKGVCWYVKDAQAALLDVDWNGHPPPTAAVVESAPEGEADIEFISPSSTEVRREKILKCRTADELNTTWSNCLDRSIPRWAACSGGQLVGISTGFSLGMTLSAEGCGAGCRVHVVRPEILNAIQPFPTIAWSDWKERCVAIWQSDELFRGACRAWNQPGNPKFTSIVADLEKAVEADPQNCGAWGTLAHAKMRMEDFDGALVAAKSGLAISPIESNSSVACAWVLYRTGDLEGALKVIHRANAAGTVGAEGCKIESAVLQGLGRLEEALVLAKKAAALDPKDKSYQEAVEYLEREVEKSADRKEPPRETGAKPKF